MTLFSALTAAATLGVQAAPPPTEYDNRLPEDEIIYFVMPDRFENGDPANDRGGLDGGPLEHGFDPTHKGFYQGGDLAGLAARLDYIQELGATAIWLTPIFKNKPVQGPPGLESSGYHGYWITDFLDVDPHLGTREEFRAFVDAAHARGMKVYMDIITNHTADVIQYRECVVPGTTECPYRSIGDYPWTTRGGPDGEAINEGFLGLDPRHQTAENFEALTSFDWAYTPFVPDDEIGSKHPEWLNDLRYYHHRGDTRFEGENSRLGDFVGLDDLMTEHPDVIDGFVDIYKQWITDFRVDGFRIDTAKHVNPEFWQEFTPEILAHAKSLGIDHFHVFGESTEFEPGPLAAFTTRDQLPTVLDFAFWKRIRGVVADGGTMRDLEMMFSADSVYAEGEATARRLPTFTGNHDLGRIAGFIRDADPDMDDDEMRRRTLLAHALIMFARGVPTIYYGDEQGFVSDGNDQAARETMFPGRTESYLDNDLIATDATIADDNFDTDHPIFRDIAAMAAIRRAEPAIRRGDQYVRHTDQDGGLMVLSRMAPDHSGEIVIAFNAENEVRNIAFPVDGQARDWESLIGTCPATAPAAGSYRLDVPALGYVVCKSEF